MAKIDSIGLLERFESSGLTQKLFAEQEGISAPMISYYLRKARSMVTHEEGHSGFSEIVVRQKAGSQIVITTSQGVRIEIPS